jgi:hypothetical protein
MVRIGGAKPRRTPARIEVPCGTVSLVIDHPRYQRVARTVEVSAGEPVEIHERLVRPRGVVTLRSSPQGASFTVNGASVGRAPARASVNAFTTINVRANLDGYAPWSDRVYVRGTDAQISASLQPPSRAGSRPPRAARPRRTTTPDL